MVLGVWAAVVPVVNVSGQSAAGLVGGGVEGRGLPACLADHGIKRDSFALVTDDLVVAARQLMEHYFMGCDLVLAASAASRSVALLRCVSGFCE